MGVTHVVKGRIPGLVLLGSLLLSACGKAPSNTEATVPPMVVDMTESVIPSQFGLITVLTQPGMNCSFSTEIKLRNGKTDQRSDETSSGADGKAYWSWLIHPNAVLGSYPLTVNCGGKSITVQYSVNQQASKQ